MRWGSPLYEGAPHTYAYVHACIGCPVQYEGLTRQSNYERKYMQINKKELQTLMNLVSKEIDYYDDEINDFLNQQIAIDHKTLTYFEELQNLYDKLGKEYYKK